MSFMSGFADAFGQQIQQGQAERAKQQEDIFNMAYQSYLNKQSQYNESLRQDNQTVLNAQGLVNSLGGAVPYGAWVHAYAWLKAGDSPDTVLQRLKTTTFASTQTPAMGETSAIQPPQAQAQNVSLPMNQTGSSTMTSQMDSGAMGQSAQPTMDTSAQIGPGNTQPATQPQTTGPTDLMGNQPTLNDGSQPPTPMPQPQDPNSNPANQNNANTGFQFINPFDRQAQFKRMADQTSAQIKGLSGVSDQEYNAINSGMGYVRQLPNTGVSISHLGQGTMQNPANAVYIPTKDGIIAGYADATSPSGFVDLNQKPIQNVTGSPMTNIQMDNNAAQTKDLSNSMQPYLQQRGSIGSLVNTAYQMQDLAKNHPVILTRLQNVPSFVNEGMNEVNALKSIISNGGTQDQINAQTQKVYGLVYNYLKNSGADANAAQELATLKVNAVYALGQLAQSNGQAGGSNRMSDEDFNNFSKSLLDENDPAILSNKLKMMTKDYMRKNDNALAIQKSLPSNQIDAKQTNVDLNSMVQPWQTYIDPEAYNWLNSPDDQPQGNGPDQSQTQQTQQKNSGFKIDGYMNDSVAKTHNIPAQYIKQPFMVNQDGSLTFQDGATFK